MTAHDHRDTAQALLIVGVLVAICALGAWWIATLL